MDMNFIELTFNKDLALFKANETSQSDVENVHLEKNFCYFTFKFIVFKFHVTNNRKRMKYAL